MEKVGGGNHKTTYELIQQEPHIAIIHIICKFVSENAHFHMITTRIVTHDNTKQLFSCVFANMQQKKHTDI